MIHADFQNLFRVFNNCSTVLELEKIEEKLITEMTQDERVNRLTTHIFNQIKETESIPKNIENYIIKAIRFFVIKDCCSRNSINGELIFEMDVDQLHEPLILPSTEFLKVFSSITLPNIKRYVLRLISENEEYNSKCAKNSLANDLLEHQLQVSKKINFSKTVFDYTSTNPQDLHRRAVFIVEIFELMKLRTEMIQQKIKYRKDCFKLNENRICSFNLGFIGIVLKLSGLDSIQVKRILENKIEYLNINYFTYEQLEKIKKFKKYPNKEVSDIGRLFLDFHRVNSSFKELNAVDANFQPFFFCLLYTNAFCNYQLTDSEKILVLKCNEEVARCWHLMTKQKQSFTDVLEYPSNTNLIFQLKLLEEWYKKELPLYHQEFKNILNKLKDIRKQKNDKIEFSKNYLTVPHYLKTKFEDYLVLTENVENYFSSLTKSSTVEPVGNTLIPKEKKETKKKQSYKSNKNKKVLKPIETKPDVLTLDTKSRQDQVKRQRSQSVSPLNLLNAFKQPLPFKYYASRVNDWFSEFPSALYELESYKFLSDKQKLHQHRMHGFSLNVDDCLNDLSIQTNIVDKATGKTHRCYVLIGRMTVGEKVCFVLIVYGVGADGVLYHRVAEPHKNKEKFLEIAIKVDETILNVNYPLLKDVAKINEYQSHPVSIPTKDSLDEVSDGPFGRIIKCQNRFLGNYKIEIFNIKD